MTDYKSSMGGLMLRIKELMIKVLFTFVVGIVSWMQNQIKDIRCWGFYKGFTYMIFNCTSFHIFNAIICYGIRILCLTIISFL
jgi:hypothetical protein